VRIAVVLGMALTMLVWTSQAAAHTSYWTGHSYITGQHWQLFYDGYDNEYYYDPVNNTCYYDHFHYVKHYYRNNPNYLYGWKHNKWHYAGDGVGCPTREHGGTFVGVPATYDPTNDVPEIIVTARSARSPEQVASALRARGSQVKLVLLSSLGSGGAVAIDAAARDTVVTAVYEDATHAWVVETATRDMARRLGH
jgi:hypothetical protein